MIMADHIAIGVETLRIASGCSLEKEFTELIHMNPWMVLYLTINQVDSCHNCVCGPLTWDTKDIFWMDDHVLIMNFESLATGYLKHHIFDMIWSPWRWLCDHDVIMRPWYLRSLTQGMRCDEILGQVSGNIRERVPDDFLHASILTWVTDYGLTNDHTLSHSWVSCVWRIIHTW